MQGFIGNDLREVTRYCKEMCREDVQEVIQMAQDILKHTFLFQCKWEMERTYIPVSFKNGEILWDRVPFGDPEWVYAMNRHRYFMTLAQAYALTGDETYTEGFIYLFNDWIKKNPCTSDYYQTTWRTIEAGLRCENWIKAHEIFKTSEHWNQDLEERFKTSLEEHAAYIISHHNDFRKLSNWGMIENHGLFLAGIYLENEYYIQTAKERLTKALRVQVLEDGLHWEQSQVYHNEVLRALLDVAICAKNNGILLDPSYHDCVIKMVDAHLYMTRPNYKQLANGDSDEMDARDILVRAAYLYKEGRFKALGYKAVDFESIWDIGVEGKAIYEQIASAFPQQVSCALEASGNYCMRDSWDEESAYVHFKCGNLGGGHGHVDLLHVDVAYLGEDILKDQGRYTYTNTKERFSLKEAKAHNTTLVDDKPFTEIIDTWAYGKVATHVQRAFKSHELYDYVEGGHLGYMDLENPVFTNRKVLFIKPNIVVLVDEFITKGAHTYKQYFHFGEGQLELGETTVFTGKRAKATLYNLETLEKEKVLMPSSKTYNQIENLETLVTTKESIGNTSLITVMVLEDQTSPITHQLTRVPIYMVGKVLEDDASAQAFKLSIGEEAYTVVVKHDEDSRGLMVVEGQELYGRVSLIHHTKEKVQSYRITY